MSIALRDVGHRFERAAWLFEGVNADFAPGQIYALTGPSGSGKSTLLSILGGWLTPARGSVIIPDGLRIGWVFQNPHGSPRRSARDHVVLPFLARGLGRERAEPFANELLERMALSHVADSPFANLSGGEAQRLMLARTIASDPQLLLIDEPTAQLDRSSSGSVVSSIGESAGEGRIVVIATHDSAVVKACSGRVEL
ncbi:MULTISPECIES: ATP-binding cassette domain-containing protein [unclassified Leifsonia]|uniref:ATP-binding cassette domain-containing protein n=1 Tax=unclassified Leifsonia TaxID=2663824 RepID=UPI000B7F8273|nr:MULTISPECIES: ATP-binding cassette domain-containing protein [unclassified Leifsonia]